jgi:hypothetical protein
MAERISQATLIEIRDNLVTAYTNLSTGGISSYTMGDRTFTYVDRAELWQQIEMLNRKILEESTTYKAYGQNRVNFEKWQ